jgi:DNA-binding MarR family transcriptional regulator
MAILAPRTRIAIFVMSLEQDIGQKDFHSEYHKAVLNILHTHYFLVDRMNDLFKKYDITRQQYNVLRILRGQLPGSASVNLIRDRMLDKMSDASRIVERLRIKEYVTRDYSENDKRRVDVKITAKGLDLLNTMQAEVDDFSNVMNNLTEPETKLLNELLDKVRAGRSSTGNPDSEEKITTLASLKI